MKFEIFQLKNNQGMIVEFLNYGGIVTKIMVPDHKGKFANVVLALPHADDYLKANPAYYGAIIGRFANRIARAHFEIEGRSFKLHQNDGANALHGGKIGFDKVFWQVTEIDKNQKYKLSYQSPDGEEGYPGNLEIEIQYSLNEENEFSIVYQATTDESTHVNLTHHSYFNLSGIEQSTIEDHELRIYADTYTVSDESYLPTGEIRPVESEINFREFKTVGKDLSELKEGYNHNYVLNNNNQLMLAATLKHKAAGREMDVLTTQPGLQFYSGHFLPSPSQGLALEAQHFPDSVHHPHFPSTLLRPGEIFAHETIYRFRNRSL